MSRTRFRKPVVIGSVLSLGAITIVGGAIIANASHGGQSSVLSSSNGSSTLKFSPSGSVTSADNGITDAAWSPDGSRAVFIDNLTGGVRTVRYNDGTYWADVADAETGVARKHPTWRGNGADVVWAEQPAAGQPWQLMLTSSSYGWNPFQITPDDGYSYTEPDGGPGTRVVYQRQAFAGGVPTGTPEIWIYDPQAGSSPEERNSLAFTNGASPAISPDGNRIAFVRSDGTYNQIYQANLTGGDVVQVTSDAANHTNPTWSHDGVTIAFGTGSAVATAPADGSGAATPTPAANLTGVPAYQPANINHVARLAGSSRFGTAIAVSQAYWATAGVTDGRAVASSVVLSRSDHFADALGGSALAAAKEGPLLMTPPTRLDAGTKTEIQRVLGSNASATVYLLGGTGAISQPVQDEISAMGYNVVRLAGSNRYSTSIAIANAIDPTPDLVLAATGANFPDALAAGAAAGSYNPPSVGYSAVVILTNDTKLPLDTVSYLNTVTSGSTEVWAIGGQAATAVEPYTLGLTEIVGSNRYMTAMFTGLVFFGGEQFAGVATGTNWPDALAGGALMATLNGPLLLTPSTSTTLNFMSEYLLNVTSGSISTGIIFGGTGAVPSAIGGQIGTSISGRGGYDTVTNPTDLLIMDDPTIMTLGSAKGGVRSLSELKSVASALAKINLTR